MPCEYVIDICRRIIRTTIRAKVTRQEILAFRGRLVRDPAFAPDLPVLIDVRNTDAEALTSLDIRGLAETSKTLPGVRRAFVATDAMAIGVARLFGTYRDLKEGQDDTAVFTTVESAERWLTQPTVALAAHDPSPCVPPATTGEHTAAGARATNPALASCCEFLSGEAEEALVADCGVRGR
jgi:hypothetical protein